MADDELTMIWRHLELLHQTVAELIELERTALPRRSQAASALNTVAERRAAARALGPDEIHRVFVGKTEERAAAVHLYDAQRRVRLRLSVAATGAAGIEFLDEAGRVTYRLPEADRATSGGGPRPAAESQG